jgi:hypothetical protein
MKRIVVIEKCCDCDSYKLYSEFHNPIKPANHLISVCAKGNFVINGYKEMDDEIDPKAKEIPENCPLEKYEQI